MSQVRHVKHISRQGPTLRWLRFPWLWSSKGLTGKASNNKLAQNNAQAQLWSSAAALLRCSTLQSYGKSRYNEWPLHTQRSTDRAKPNCTKGRKAKNRGKQEDKSRVHARILASTSLQDIRAVAFAAAKIVGLCVGYLPNGSRAGFHWPSCSDALGSSSVLRLVAPVHWGQSIDLQVIQVRPSVGHATVILWRVTTLASVTLQ